MIINPKSHPAVNGSANPFLNEGQLTATVWPKLSKKEQQHWQALADQIEHPQTAGQNDENSTLDDS